MSQWLRDGTDFKKNQVWFLAPMLGSPQPPLSSVAGESTPSTSVGTHTHVNTCN